MLFIGFRSNKFVQLRKRQLKIKIKLVMNPIMVHLAQGIVRPSFNIALGVKVSIF